MKKRLTLLGLLILVVAIPVVIFLAHSYENVKQKAQASGNVTSRSVIGQIPEEVIAGSLISLNAPAFASSGYYPASNANDDSYDTT